MGVDCVGASMREHGHPSRAYAAGKRELNEAHKNMMGDQTDENRRRRDQAVQAR
jgi:hypothetical protein